MSDIKRAKVGDRITISKLEMASAGYLLNAFYDKQSLELIVVTNGAQAHDPHAITDPNKIPVGSFNTKEFVFLVKRSGVHEVIFRQERPWAPNDDPQVTTVTVQAFD